MLLCCTKPLWWLTGGLRCLHAGRELFACRLPHHTISLACFPAPLPVMGCGSFFHVPVSRCMCCQTHVQCCVTYGCWRTVLVFVCVSLQQVAWKAKHVKRSAYFHNQVLCDYLCHVLLPRRCDSFTGQAFQCAAHSCAAHGPDCWFGGGSRLCSVLLFGFCMAFAF